MGKPTILVAAILATLLAFGILVWTFAGLRGHLVGYFEGAYLQPSPQDSLYSQLLQGTEHRSEAIQISHEVQPFYFWVDSAYTLLRAGLSPELTHIALVQSGISDSLHQHLRALEQADALQCQPPCLGEYLQTREAWEAFLQGQNPKELEVYLKATIRRVREAELQALERVSETIRDTTLGR